MWIYLNLYNEEEKMSKFVGQNKTIVLDRQHESKKHLDLLPKNAIPVRIYPECVFFVRRAFYNSVLILNSVYRKESKRVQKSLELSGKFQKGPESSRLIRTLSYK